MCFWNPTVFKRDTYNCPYTIIPPLQYPTKLISLRIMRASQEFWVIEGFPILINSWPFMTSKLWQTRSFFFPTSQTQRSGWNPLYRNLWNPILFKHDIARIPLDYYPTAIIPYKTAWLTNCGGLPGGFGEQWNVIIYFKGTRDILGLIWGNNRYLLYHRELWQSILGNKGEKVTFSRDHWNTPPPSTLLRRPSIFRRCGMT